MMRTRLTALLTAALLPALALSLEGCAHSQSFVLSGGVRRPVVGVVTMDQVMVDCGPDGGGVGRGDEAVLIGAQGDERIAVEELAGALDTIAYEILTGVGRRAERVAV